MNLLYKLLIILRQKAGTGVPPIVQNDWQWEDGSSLMWEDNTEILTEE